MKALLQVLGLYVFPIFKYFLKYFAQIHRVWSRHVSVPPRDTNMAAGK